MRLLISGIIVLSGLAFAVQMLEVHGATDEQAAIRRAVREPFRDLRRRDARALCEDFTPAVADHLIAAGGSCAARVSRLFSLSARHAEYLPARDRVAVGPLDVRAIAWDGARARASSTGSGDAGHELRWRLSLLRGRWRIATPMTLQLRPDCTDRPLHSSACLDTLTLRLAERGQA
jgi:hypothetical protein